MTDLRERCAAHARAPLRLGRTEAAALARGLLRARPDAAAGRQRASICAQRLHAAHGSALQCAPARWRCDKAPWPT